MNGADTRSRRNGHKAFQRKQPGSEEYLYLQRSKRGNLNQEALFMTNKKIENVSNTGEPLHRVRRLIKATHRWRISNSIALLLVLLSIHANAQEPTATEFDGHKWEAPYHLIIPKDWTIERFLIPISFAPQIAYKGIEDIRFAPGWSKAETEEYWTYAFLWYVDGSPKTDAAIISSNLKAYYTGLIEINRESYKLPKEKLIPVVTTFKEMATANGDTRTYTGTIEMLDYMGQKPITLNCIAHLRSCPEEKKTVLFYELSPKPFSHGNWAALKQIWVSFTCKRDGNKN